MKILIDDIKLELLLEKKREFIGKCVALDSFLSAFSFLISVFLASYKDFFGISGNILKTIFVILGFFFTGKSIFDIYKSKKNSYSYEDLLSDINKLNEITHDHSIVILKDTFESYSNRILVYDDKRWDCKLFLNYKGNVNNENFIKDHLSSELKIELDNIELKYLGQKIHEKYSESAKENKVYCHKFYLANVKSFPELMKRSVFECDGKTYHWMTIDELEQDKEVQKKNSDVLSYVKELV